MGMYGIFFGVDFVSEFLINYWQLVVIDDCDLFGSCFYPDKANAILSRVMVKCLFPVKNEARQVNQGDLLH